MTRLACPDMTLVQLRYFVAAATKRSMTEAAQELHVAQSGISTAIAQLERGLGVQLFVRQRSRGLALTDAGEQLLIDARSTLAQVDEMTDAVRGKHYDVRGTLRLACFVTLAPFVLPTLISKVRELHPGLRIEIIEADVDGTIDLLLSGSVETAIAYDFGRAHGLTFDTLYAAAPHAVLPRGHRLAQQEQITLTELADEDLVLLDIPHSREYFLGMHDAAGVEPRIRYSSRSYETIRSLVARGEGYSVLNHVPQSPVTYDGGEVASVPLTGPGTNPLDVCVVRVTSVRPAARARVISTLAREMFGATPPR